MRPSKLTTLWPDIEISVDFIRYGCDATMVQLRLCENIAFLLTGFDHAQANMVRILHNNQEEYGRMQKNKFFFILSLP